jgi:NTE family protein
VRLFIKADHYKAINSKLVFSQNAVLAYIIDNNPYITNLFLVGGISDIMSNQIPFAGLGESEIKTGSIAAIKLSLQYALSKNNYLTGRINAALYDFQNTERNITAANNLITGYGLTYGYDSAIGPIEFSAVYCDQDGIVRYSMSLGFNF